MLSAAPVTASAADPHDEGFGLYVHWPFCVSKCPYCDFNSHVSDDVNHARWRDALVRELDHYGAQTEGRTLTSVFFGGGTPSLMAPETAGAVLERAAHWWQTRPDLEVTLEANPGTVDQARFSALNQAGIRRLSVGVQSLDDKALVFLGRRHSADQARVALKAAAGMFEAVSADFIYALPGQSLNRWRDDLSEALALLTGAGAAHLSVYQLTIEPGTAFETAVRRCDFAPLDDDTAADLFDLTQEVLNEAGLPAYEVSNHAAPDKACRHNLTYWRGGDYVGIGPGAHGRVTGPGGLRATRQARLPEKWLERVGKTGHGTAAETPVSARDRAQELLLSGLRLTEGINAARFERLSGVPFHQAVDREAAERLCALGFVRATELGLAVTPKGMPVLNRVIADLAR